VGPITNFLFIWEEDRFVFLKDISEHLVSMISGQDDQAAASAVFILREHQFLVVDPHAFEEVLLARIFLQMITPLNYLLQEQLHNVDEDVDLTAPALPVELLELLHPLVIDALEESHLRFNAVPVRERLGLALGVLLLPRCLQLPLLLKIVVDPSLQMLQTEIVIPPREFVLLDGGFLILSHHLLGFNFERQ
jgi:hypothetical protein